MKHTAQFRDVGRDKVSWDVEFDRFPIDMVLRAAIRKRRALGSRSIEFYWDDDAEADIYVGGIRKVGTVRIVAAPSPAPAPGPEAEAKP